MVTAVKLGLGIEQPIAPEALGVTSAQWKLLGSANATRHLRDYAAFRRKDEVIWRVPTFLEAAKPLTLASTLSYATENEAQKLLDAHATGNWEAKLVVDGTSKRAQAMLLTSKIDSFPSVTAGAAAAGPIAILALRGTELPVDENEGWLECFLDWLRN